MKARWMSQLFGVVAISMLISACASAQVTLDDFAAALSSIPVSTPGPMLAAIETGMAQPDFAADLLIRLIDRLSSNASPAYEKESLLSILSHALTDGLPIESLINKALEGVARGVPLPNIEQDLSIRLNLLSQTRDLFYAKGIFSAPPGVPQTVPTAIPAARFNQLLINVSEPVTDFLEAGGSPFDSQSIYQEVHNRLTLLQGVTLSKSDVELVLDRVAASDLTQIALAAVS
jgi:hypothetical protein